MKVNRVISVNYSNNNSNIDKSRVLFNRNRVLLTPNFGNSSDIADRAIVDQYISLAQDTVQKERDAVVDPLGAISRKFADLVKMLTPKSRTRAAALEDAINFTYGYSPNNILYK